MAAATLVKSIRAAAEMFASAHESLVEIKDTVGQIVEAGQEIKGFWQTVASWFVKEKKQVKEQAKSTVVHKKKKTWQTIDQTQIKIDLVNYLGEFFVLQEQLATEIRRQEIESQTVVSNENLMTASLKRVMAEQQMIELNQQITEILVYETPGLGDLYAQTMKMRETIKREQQGAREKLEQEHRYKAWQQREAQRNVKAKQAWLLGTAGCLLYLWVFLILLNRLPKS